MEKVNKDNLAVLCRIMNCYACNIFVQMVEYLVQRQSTTIDWYKYMYELNYSIAITIIPM
jgi:hypothetical protein